MKISNIATLSLLAAMTFSGCEMKDELYGGKNKDADNGSLELSVAVKQPYSQSRAGEVSTDNFPVKIEGSELDNALEYATASDIPASITLPVGSYTVSAHTPGEIEKKMTAPYYAGSNTLNITKGVTARTTVTCKMKNTQVKLVYGDTFLSGFKSWTITITAGTDNVLTYEKASSSPDPVYLNIEDEKVESVIVNISAVTNTGIEIADAKTFKKSDAAESYSDVNNWFEGGDAIAINMGVIAASTGTVTGITINAKVSFEDKKEDVLIDPSEGTTTPDTPAGDGPTITLPNDVTFSVNDEEEDMPSAVAVIKAPATLKSMYVKIIPGNTGFEEALALTNSVGLNFLDGDGVDMVADAENVNKLFTMVGKPEVKAPTTDLTEYNFAIDTFFTFLSDPTTGSGESPHQFVIKVIDDNGKEVSGIFKVNITE